MRLLLPLFLFCLSMTGCMDLKVKFDLQADGRMATKLNLSMLSMMFDHVLMLAGQSGMDLSFLQEDNIKDFTSSKGGTLRSFSNREEKGMRQIDLDIQFADGLAFWRQVAPGLVTLVREGEGYKLAILDNELGRSMASLDQASVDQQMAMFQTLLPGLIWEIEWIVPELLDTNLSKPGGNKAQFRFEYDKDLAGKSGVAAIDAFTRFLGPKWVKFKGTK